MSGVEHIRPRPEFTIESFSKLPPLEQRLLIYFLTIPVESDLSLEELSIVGIEISEKSEDEEKRKDVEEALNDLKQQGLLHSGFNPLRKKQLEEQARKLDHMGMVISTPAKEHIRFYVEPEIHNFVSVELPKIWDAQQD